MISFDPPPSREPGYWLSVHQGDELISRQPISDPFHSTRIYAKGLRGRLSWAWAAIRGKLDFTVGVEADPPITMAVMAIDPVEAVRDFQVAQQERQEALAALAAATGGQGVGSAVTAAEEE